MRCNGDTTEDENEGTTLQDDLRSIQILIARTMAYIQRQEYDNAAYHLGYANCELRYLMQSIQNIEDEQHGYEN
jgi:hypothetical protein